ncbi:IS3 family transposase [Brevibacterium sp. CS2]|uniref:IS3 family transposase n=1 Tax=Brevibacterium sp. CS2 TaxID=2575923 RepID=UPI0020C7BB62|nr:IS3 family transposase [Brevibacterium sp. CS2]
MIRVEAGMSTARFCQLFDMPERTWRRWQAKARTGTAVKGPWPQPARQAARELVVEHALAHPAWGHRKIWAMVRHDGHVVSEATVLRILRDEGLILPAQYQRERRKLAERRKAAFATEPTGPNQVWQLDFSEFETTTGGDLAAGRVPGLLVQVRAPLPRFAHREPARRDRRDRVGPGRLRGHVRSPAGRGLPGRSRDR